MRTHKTLIFSSALLIGMLSVSSTASATIGVFTDATLSPWYSPGAGFQQRDITFEGDQAIPVGARIIDVHCSVRDETTAFGNLERVAVIPSFDGVEVGTGYSSIFGGDPQNGVGHTFGTGNVPVGITVTAEGQVTGRVRRSNFSNSQQFVYSCHAIWNSPCDENNCVAPDFCHWENNACIEDSAATTLFSYDFNGANSTDLNYSDPAGPWDVSTAAVRTDHVQVLSSELKHHYFAHDPGGANMEVLPALYNNHTDDLVADGVAVFTGRGYSNYYMGGGRVFGLSYRMPSSVGDYCSAGYHLLIDNAGIELTKDCGDVVGSWAGSIDTAFHEYRVVFEGDEHVVYMDGQYLFTAIDSDYVAAGYTGVSSYYSVSFFDDFRVLFPPTF